MNQHPDPTRAWEATRGKTYEEIYGITRAQQLKKLRSEKMSAQRKGRPPWNKGMKGAQVAWNKGLNKSDSRVASYARPGSKKRRHTMEEILKMSIALKGRKKPLEYAVRIRQLMATGRMRPYLTRPDHYNKPESQFKNFLTNLGFKENLDYCHNYQVSGYFLDFAFIPALVDIEIDGEYWHRDTEKDNRRDVELRELGWQVARIPARLVRFL